MSDVEANSGLTLDKLVRDSVANGLALQRILEHFKIEDVTEEDVDEAIDQQ